MGTTTPSAVPVATGATSVPSEIPVATGVPVSAATSAASTGLPIATPLDTSPLREIRRIHGEPSIMQAHLPLCPPGCAPGGRYVEVSFFGGNSLLCCFFALVFAPPVALCVPCFPCDRHLVYLSPDGSAWDPESGHLVGYYH